MNDAARRRLDAGPQRVPAVRRRSGHPGTAAVRVAAPALLPHGASGREARREAGTPTATSRCLPRASRCRSSRSWSRRCFIPSPTSSISSASPVWRSPCATSGTTKPVSGPARDRQAAARRERFVTHARILKVVPTLMCGGTENQFMTLSRRLDPARFDLEFACLRRWGPFVQELAERRIPLSEYQVSTFRSVQALAQQARLARHIARRRIQIVHAYNFYGNVFAVPPARLAAPVVIASIRDCAPYLTPMQKRVQRYACQFADCVLVNADRREGLADRRRLRRVEDRRDSERRRPGRLRRRQRMRIGSAASWGWRRQTPLVAVVSRLTRLKGLENLLEAAAMLKPRYPDVALSGRRRDEPDGSALSRRVEAARRPAWRRRPRDLHGPTVRRAGAARRASTSR